MPPPVLSVVRYKGAGDPQVYILNSNVSPATLTPDGDALTGVGLESTSSTVRRSQSNRVISAFGEKFWLHRDRVYMKGATTADDWGEVFQLTPIVNVRDHSGIHLMHPNGVPTLVLAWLDSTGIYVAKSSDGINWTTINTGAIATVAYRWHGQSLVWGSRLVWAYRSANDTEAAFIYDFETDIRTLPNISNDLGGAPTQNTLSLNCVPCIHVHQNHLFMFGAVSGNSQVSVWRFIGSSFAFIFEILSWEPNSGSSLGMWTDTDDPTVFIVAGFDINPVFRRINNPLDMNPANITGTGLTIGTAGILGDPGGWTVYVDADNQTDLDGSGNRPIVYLWYNQGGMDSGQYDLYQYNGQTNPLTLVSSGVNLPTNQYGLVYITDGGGDRIPTEGARPALEGPPVELGGGRTKWFFRMYGVNFTAFETVNIGVYFNANGHAPDTPATLVPGSLVIEDDPNPTFITMPDISATGSQIENVTPDYGATLYSFEVETTLDGIIDGQFYTLMMDII